MDTSAFGPSDLPCPSYSIVVTAIPSLTKRWNCIRFRKDALSMYPWHRHTTARISAPFLGVIVDVISAIPRSFVQYPSSISTSGHLSWSGRSVRDRNSLHRRRRDSAQSFSLKE